MGVAVSVWQVFSSLSYLVVLLDDVLCCQGVVLQIPGQVEHILRQFLLQVVVALQDGVQLCGRLTLVHRETSAEFPGIFVRCINGDTPSNVYCTAGFYLLFLRSPSKLPVRINSQELKKIKILNL